MITGVQMKLYPTKRVPIVLGLSISTLILLFLDSPDYLLMASASFGLIGIFGGIAVAAAVLYFSDADRICERAIRQYRRLRPLSLQAELSMRRKFLSARTHVQDDVILIVWYSIFNFILLLIGTLSLPFIDDHYGTWKARAIHALCTLSIIAAMYAVLDIVRSIYRLKDIEAEADRAERAGSSSTHD